MFDPSDACMKDLEGRSKQNADVLVLLFMLASLTVWDPVSRGSIS